MQDKFVQSIRYKLQKRVRRLNSANFEQFPFLLRSFLRYLDDTPILAGVRDELLVRAATHEPAKSIDRIIAGESLYPEAEPEAAAMGYLLLKEGVRNFVCGHRSVVRQGPISHEELEAAVRRFKKAIIERALGGELSHHLGYPPEGTKPEDTTNHRNGTGGKTVLTDDGLLASDVPRDRAGTFRLRIEPLDDAVH